MKPIDKLHELGQSIWYDNIERSLLIDGGLLRMVQSGEIRGVTSNPSIFNNAIMNSSIYDQALIPLALAGKNNEAIYEALAIDDIQAACDILNPVYRESSWKDGYVSFEVSPYLARKTALTLIETERLWSLVNRRNLMIKIPATKEGLPAITHAIQQGININVTLIFSIDRYREVMDAYLLGLEQRLESGKPIDHVASVASFFVSRIDTNIDNRLRELVDAGEVLKENATEIQGKIAVANAKLAYQLSRKVFSSKRFEALKIKGGRVQRPLWASTSTKNPVYRDTKYIEELIGPGTINTVPPNTLKAFADHGVATLALENGIDASQDVMENLESNGISMAEVTQELEYQGVDSFAEAFTSLLDSIEKRRLAALQNI